MNLSPPKRELGVDTRIWPVFVTVFGFMAGVALVMPWLVRVFTWLDLGGMYNRYAKWACQC